MLYSLIKGIKGSLGQSASKRPIDFNVWHGQSTLAAWSVVEGLI